MDTKECIEFLKSDKRKYYDNQTYQNNIDEVIKRLQMWEELKRDIESNRYYNILDYRDSKGNSLISKLEGLEQRYFSKKIKKTITVDIEADEVSYQEFLIRLKMLEAPSNIEKKFIKLDIRKVPNDKNRL